MKGAVSTALALSLTVWCAPAAYAAEVPEQTGEVNAAADGAGLGQAGADAQADGDAAPGCTDGDSVSAAIPLSSEASCADGALAASEASSSEAQSALSDGDYVITAAENSSAVLSVAGYAFFSGANVELAKADGTLFQKWHVAVDGDGWCTITSLATGKVLDCADGGKAPGTNVWQCTPFGNDAQKWKASRNADGTITFTAKHSGLALDIADGWTVPGQNVQTYTPNGAQAQRFEVRSAEVAPKQVLPDGVYEVRSSAGRDFALDVADASQRSGANVQLYRANGTQGQKWYVTSDADGWYTLYSLGSGKVLDVADGGLVPGTNVWQCTPFGNSMQRWRIEQNADGTYSLYSQGSGLALDVAWGIAENGQNVQTYTPNGALAQRFEFKAAQVLTEGVYAIGSRADSDSLVDAGASKDAGAALQMGASRGTFAQKWQATCDGDGLWTFESLLSGKVLAVSGAEVRQEQATGAATQKWRVEALASGGVRIVSAASGAALAAESDALRAEAVLTDSAAQAFVFQKTAIVEDGYYTVGAFANPDIRLDVQDAARYSGANVQMYAAHDTNAQVTRFEANGDGTYTVSFPFSRKVLDVTDGGTAPGTNVQQCTPFDNSAQKWVVKYAGGGSFTLVNKGNGLALDIADGAAKSGANVQVYTQNGTDGQRFVLEPTEYVPDDFSDHMAHFETLSTNTINGWYNMSRALSNFDGMVVQPGETVSFFDTCGPCGAAQGYLIAGVVGGEGYGGGICQASTTLYGAVLRSGLTIVERQNHSEPSKYVPIGQDAMVNWGTSDFRFRNDWDFPVKFVVTCENRVLNCDVYGIQPDWYDEVRVSSWWTGSNSAAAQREYYKGGELVHVSKLPNSYYW